MPPPLFSLTVPRIEPPALLAGAGASDDDALALTLLAADAPADVSVSVSASASTCAQPRRRLPVFSGSAAHHARRQGCRSRRAPGCRSRRAPYLEVLHVLVVDEPVAALARDPAHLVQRLHHARSVGRGLGDELVLRAGNGREKTVGGNSRGRGGGRAGGW